MSGKRVAVAGGGAAGLMAALSAATAGCEVVLFEAMPSPGRKLLVTGGGRCNLTTTASTVDIMQAFGRHGRFAAPALDFYGTAEIRNFFAAAGVPTVSEADGSVFPESQRAGDILRVLQETAEAAGVTILCNRKISGVELSADGRVIGVSPGKGVVRCEALVLATGGCSYPALGSDGSGWRVARQLGVAVVRPTPSLVPLVVAEEWPTTLSGIVLPRARLRLEARRASRTGVEGALLFTHRGISGPVTLAVSGEVAERLETSGGSVVLRLSIDASRGVDSWLQLFESWQRQWPQRLCRNLLSGEVTRRVAEVLCQTAGVAEAVVGQAGRSRLRELAELCANAPLTVTATEGWARAIITRGGIDRRELDPQSLAVRRVSGLFCAGECVDIDGPCGGYNLTWAFASGALAGHAAAAYLAKEAASAKP
ncbi:MAG: aminoacetone oxidase family FAD-binding enzyme [Lentisphaerae bacterium]|nr:aminoacetone oxidase family FAD-binding enzyme [Lentisphaerota bacterium]